MEISNSDIMIVQAAIELGHNLGLKVVAEGVENEEIYDLLSMLGCDNAQGFYMGRPMPPTEFIDWLGKSLWGLKSKSES